MAEWTLDEVAERFREAAETAHRLPKVGVQGYFNTWPAIKREARELYTDPDRVLRFPPTPEAIDRMEETMRWVLWLEEPQRHLVWSGPRSGNGRTLRGGSLAIGPRRGGAGSGRYRASLRNSAAHQRRDDADWTVVSLRRGSSPSPRPRGHRRIRARTRRDGLSRGHGAVVQRAEMSGWGAAAHSLAPVGHASP